MNKPKRMRKVRVPLGTISKRTALKEWLQEMGHEATLDGLEIRNSRSGAVVTRLDTEPNPDYDADMALWEANREQARVDLENTIAQLQEQLKEYTDEDTTD